MSKLTRRQKVMIRRAVFSVVMTILVGVVGLVTFAGLMDMVFESYESVRKAIGALVAVGGGLTLGVLFYVWDELIFTNVRK